MNETTYKVWSKGMYRYLGTSNVQHIMCINDDGQPEQVKCCYEYLTDYEAYCALRKQEGLILWKDTSGNDCAAIHVGDSSIFILHNDGTRTVSEYVPDEGNNLYLALCKYVPGYNISSIGNCDSKNPKGEN